jgi:hypothetical protein
MSLAKNLALANEAIEHVRSLSIAASNRRSDRIRAAGGVDRVIGTDQGMRTLNLGPAGQGVGAVREGVNDVLQGGFTVFALRALAFAAARAHSGNCMEQAAIAFGYLAERGARPLDYVAFTKPGYDHVWVVLGLANSWKRDNLRSWGREAVWCDPWQSGGVAFAIDDLVKGKVRNLDATYLCNTAERVEAGNPRSLVHL